MTEAFDRVAVLGFGPSLRCLAERDAARLIDRGVAVIAVNRAILAWPATHWFTLDPDDRNRPIMAAKPRAATYYAAVPGDYGCRDAARTLHRAPAEPGVTYLRRIEGRGRWKAVPTLSEDQGAIHTGNSAWGALQVAWLMNAKRIGIFGVDGSPNGYARGPGTPYDLGHLPALFATAVGQIRERGVFVFNASPLSRVICFPRCPVERGLRWLTDP